MCIKILLNILRVPNTRVPNNTYIGMYICIIGIVVIIKSVI